MTEYGKKILSVILCWLLVCTLFAFTACGQNDEQNVPPTADTAADSAAVTEPEENAGTIADEPEAELEPDEEEAEQTETTTGLSPEDVFSDAVFIGDSVTIGFRNYCVRNNVLQGSQTVCSMSYSVNHAINDTMILFFKGERCNMEQAIKASGAKHVFILLGINDINLHGVDKYVENWGVLIKRIRDMNPDVTIYIESCTPAYIGPENNKLSNKDIDARNEAMVQFCAENDVHFIDVATPLKDGQGGLADLYSSDNFIHLSDQGYDVLLEALTEYLEEAY